MGSSNSIHLGCFCNPFTVVFLAVPLMNIIFGSVDVFDTCECSLPSLGMHFYLIMHGACLLVYEILCILQFCMEDMEGDTVRLSAMSALTWLTAMALVGWIFVGAGLFITSTVCKVNGDYNPCSGDLNIYPYFTVQVMLSLLILLVAFILVYRRCRSQSAETDPDETRPILPPNRDQASIQGVDSDRPTRRMMELMKGPNFAYWITSALPGTRRTSHADADHIAT